MDAERSTNLKRVLDAVSAADTAFTKFTD